MLDDFATFSVRCFDQPREHFVQPSGKFLIQASDLAKQSANYNPESP